MEFALCVIHWNIHRGADKTTKFQPHSSFTAQFMVSLFVEMVLMSLNCDFESARWLDLNS